MAPANPLIPSVIVDDLAGQRSRFEIDCNSGHFGRDEDAGGSSGSTRSSESLAQLRKQAVKTLRGDHGIELVPLGRDQAKPGDGQVDYLVALGGLVDPPDPFEQLIAG